MRLCELFVLCFLLATSAANYQTDDQESEQEIDAVRRMMTNKVKLSKRLRWEESDRDRKRVPVEHVRRTSSDGLEHPVRISVFNAGDYDAFLKLNYILNDLQVEEEIDEPIREGTERDLLLPHSASHIRIRVPVEGFLKDQMLIDRQYTSFDGVKEICYVLAGSREHAVYGLCAFPFEQYLQFWRRMRKI